LDDRFVVFLSFLGKKNPAKRLCMFAQGQETWNSFTSKIYEDAREIYLSVFSYFGWCDMKTTEQAILSKHLWYLLHEGGDLAVGTIRIMFVFQTLGDTQRVSQSLSVSIFKQDFWICQLRALFECVIHCKQGLFRQCIEPP